MTKSVAALLDKTISNLFSLFHQSPTDEMRQKVMDTLCSFVHSIPKKFDDEPIRPRNAFMFYCIDNGEKVAKSSIMAKTGGAIKKILASDWAILQDSEKDVYRKKAEMDVLRYETEIQSYSVKNPIWKGKLKISGDREEPKSKKAVSAYNIFLSDAIKEIKRDNPTLSRKEVMRLISTKWGQISTTSPEEDGYDIYKSCVDKANEDRVSKGFKAIRVMEEGVAIPKSVEIPLTAYKLFLMKFFDEYKIQNPDLNSKQLYKLLREEWRLIRASKMGDSRYKIKQALEIEVYENKIAIMKKFDS